MRIKPLSMNLAALAVAFLATSACNKEHGASPAAGPRASSDLAPNTVVATYNDKKVTVAELDEFVKGRLNELEEQKYQIRRQGLDPMIMQTLVQAEAAKLGISEEEYFKREIEDK